jgi:hypothetical protein
LADLLTARWLARCGGGGAAVAVVASAPSLSSLHATLVVAGGGLFSANAPLPAAPDAAARQVGVITFFFF